MCAFVVCCVRSVLFRVHVVYDMCGVYVVCCVGMCRMCRMVCMCAMCVVCGVYVPVVSMYMRCVYMYMRWGDRCEMCGVFVVCVVRCGVCVCVCVCVA